VGEHGILAFVSNLNRQEALVKGPAGVVPAQAADEFGVEFDAKVLLPFTKRRESGRRRPSISPSAVFFGRRRFEAQGWFICRQAVAPTQGAPTITASLLFGLRGGGAILVC
jgi:hypothetical protein